MVELRWAILPNGLTRLQYRIRPAVVSFGAPAGWSDWMDVPHVMVPASGVPACYGLPGSYVNAAEIGGGDKPHTVVQKLDAAARAAGGVPGLGDGAEQRIEAAVEKLRRCKLGCGPFGQCKAAMHGVPSECASARPIGWASNPDVAAGEELTEDQRAAVKFYADNPRAALFDFSQRTKRNAGVQGRPASTLLDADSLGMHVVQFATEAEEIAALRAELARLARPAGQIVRAFQIADEAMYELLLAEGIPDDIPDTSHIHLCNEECREVAKLAEASEAMREAFEWLQPRGYVELGTDSQGEFINVVRRPGEDG